MVVERVNICQKLSQRVIAPTLTASWFCRCYWWRLERDGKEKVVCNEGCTHTHTHTRVRAYICICHTRNICRTTAMPCRSHGKPNSLTDSRKSIQRELRVYCFRLRLSSESPLYKSPIQRLENLNKDQLGEHETTIELMHTLVYRMFVFLNNKKIFKNVRPRRNVCYNKVSKKRRKNKNASLW